MSSQLLGMEIKVGDASVSDSVSEIVNIVAGGAKAKFTDVYQKGSKPIKLSLPIVIRGNSFSIDYPSKSMWLEVPFNSDLGGFTLRVTFEVDKSGKGSK